MQGGRKYITKIDAAGIDTDKMTIARSIANYSKVRIPIVFESGYRHKEDLERTGRSAIGCANGNIDCPDIIVSEIHNDKIPAGVTGYLVEIDLESVGLEAFEKAKSTGFELNFKSGK